MKKVEDEIYSPRYENPRDWHLVFIGASLCFIFGLWLGKVLNLAIVDSIWLLSVYVILVMSLTIFSSSRRKLIYFSLVVGLGLAGGLFRSVTFVDYRSELDSYADKKIEFRAEIMSEPDERETSTKLVIRPEKHKTKILVTVERYPQYRRGDFVSVQGKISLPKNMATATGTPFDYRSYLAKDGIYYEMFKPKVDLVNRPSYGIFVSLANLKSKLLSVISDILPEPESSLLAGILLGAKKGLGTEITNDFKLAGVSHVLVLSGYNITFVALFILSVCALLPRFIGGFGGFLGIIAFGLLAGGGTVVWRAVLMSLVAYYAKLTGRIFDVGAAIMFSAVALVAYNPASLIDDLGFQLSVMAMIGIVYIAPILKEKIFYRVTERFTLREIVSSTFGAQLAVLPLLWQSTGQISVIGFISNLFILPFVPYAMIWGAGAVSLGAISPIIAWPATVVTYVLLKIVLIFVHVFAHAPLAGLSFTSGSWWFVVIIYCVIFMPVVKYWVKKSATVIPAEAGILNLNDKTSFLPPQE